MQDMLQSGGRSTSKVTVGVSEWGCGAHVKCPVAGRVRAVTWRRHSSKFLYLLSYYV